MTQTTSDTTKKLLTKKEAADILRVSVRTLENYIEKGYIKPIKIGKAIRFSHDFLDEVTHQPAA